jgi:Tfp pilus assembly protein PilF
VFLGLDGADWQLLDRYVAAGRMPRLAELLKHSSAGVLESLQPPLSPLVWTTMMSGTPPTEHGVLDFTRFHPHSGQREPITSTERRVPAIWDMASASGRSSAVLGMWATWPAEAVRGLMVSDRFYSFQHADAVPPRAVFPAEREAWARQRRLRIERDTGFEALREYLPWLERQQYELIAAGDPYAHPAGALRRILVETRLYDALAAEAFERDSPDLTVLYVQGTDAIGHIFAPYAPPRQPSVSETDHERYGRVPELYFAEIDELLGRWATRARAAGASLFVASDHGFHWAEGRPEAEARFEAATAGRWHRGDGVFLLAGPGIAPAAARGRAGVGQVCVTLLALLGLPPGRGVLGPPLPGVPVPRGPETDYRSGWRRPAEPDELPAAGAEELEELRALGYIGAGEAAEAPAAAPPGSTRTPGSYNNEGLYLLSQGQSAAAAAAFERALGLEPRHASALLNLGELLAREGRELERSDELLARALGAGAPEALSRVRGRAVALRRAGDAGRAERLATSALAARPESELHLFRGRLRLEREDCAGARDDFQEAAALAPQSALAHSSLGLASLCLGDEPAAQAAFRRSLELDPDQPELSRALGD